MADKLASVQTSEIQRGAWLCHLCAALFLWTGLVGVVNADWREDIGYDRLVTMVGSSLPNGSGIPISIVEAIQTKVDQDTGELIFRNYRPDPNYSEFTAPNDPNGMVAIITDVSNVTCPNDGILPNGCQGFSTHARGQSSRFFGNTQSLAPAANEVDLYEANHYLNSVLHASGGVAPEIKNYRVQNFSWVATLGNLSSDLSALRRFDFAIERDNITAVVGLDNGSNKTIPPLFAHSYNAIAMGTSDADHSTGFTDLPGYGVGRSKPDLVMPQDTTSAATSATSSVATFLHSVVAADPDAKRSETIKAILMAGATKKVSLDGFSELQDVGWTQGFDAIEPTLVTTPLDETYGAGQVSAYNSYVITQGGRFAGSNSTPTPVASHGWDYQTITGGSGNELEYLFSVPEGSTATELSILLDWNVDVAGGLNSQTLADFSLELKDSLGAVVQTSNSAVDNVEHLYLTNLAAGDYTLSVSSDMTHDFGLAWRTSTLFGTPGNFTKSADFDGDGDVDGSDFLAWQRGYGKLLGAAPSEGDADGDGDVDADDIMVFHTQYGSPPELASAYVVAVPEPSTMVLVAGGMFAFLLRRRRKASWGRLPACRLK